MSNGKNQRSPERAGAGVCLTGMERSAYNTSQVILGEE
jgi:hypothetical protein